MSKEIKGISFKIGADTTSLDKALSDVNKRAGSTQRELSKVNKSLKFNPKNVVLTAQKQELLTKQVANTKEKLDKLKSAEAQVQEQFKKGKITEEQYRAYQREIEETSSKLKHYKQQLKDVNSHSGTFNTRMQTMSSKLGAVGSKVSDVGKKLTTKLTAPIVAVGIACAKMSLDFEDSIAQINTLLDDEKHLDGYKKKVLEVSNKTGIAADVMSKGMYQAISSLGDQGKKTEKMFDTMAKSARAGGAEVSESVALISAGMKGYGTVNDKTAKKISDLAFTTAKLGVTTFPEMASSMQALFPLSSSLGLSMEELFGSMATLTGVTGNTSEVSTQLKAVMSGLMKPTKSMSSLIQKYGYDNAQAMIESEGLTGVLQILQTETGGQSDKMAQLFGSTEALTAMTALSGQNFDELKDKMGKMKDATGATDDALKKVDKPRGQKLKKSLNKLKNTAIKFGEALTPVIESVSKLLKKITDRLDNLSPKQKKMIAKIGLIVAAIGPLLIVVGKVLIFLGKVIPIVVKIIGFIKTAIEVISAIIHFIGLAVGVSAGAAAAIVAVVALIVATLVAAGIWVHKHWDEIKQWAHELKGNLKQKFEEIKQAVVDKFTAIKTKALEKVESLKTSLAEKWNSIKNTAKEKFEQVKNVIVSPFVKVKDKVKGIIDEIKSFFSKLKLKEIKIPKPKLPHFKLTGEFSLKKMTVPKLSINWNAQGAIFTKPYIFGNQGVGEAGPEAVLPISKLSGIIADSLNKIQMKDNGSVYVKMMAQQEQRAYQASQNNQKQIIGMLDKYLPEYLNALDMSVVLDDGTLVGKLTPKIDNRLGASFKRKARGGI